MEKELVGVDNGLEEGGLRSGKGGGDGIGTGWG